MTLEERFWKYTEKGRGCWLWVGYKIHGYGFLWDTDKMRQAHRISWELHRGPIPKGKWVLHKCDVHACVRPSHLFIGTRLDNINDCVDKERHARGETNGHAKLTATQVRKIRSLKGKQLDRDIAEQFGIHKSCVSAIWIRRTWKHI